MWVATGTVAVASQCLPRSLSLRRLRLGAVRRRTVAAARGAGFPGPARIHAPTVSITAQLQSWLSHSSTTVNLSVLKCSCLSFTVSYSVAGGWPLLPHSGWHGSLAWLVTFKLPSYAAAATAPPPPRRGSDSLAFQILSLGWKLDFYAWKPDP